MIELEKNVKYVKVVGPARVELLNKIGIFTLKDLITYYPREYEDRSETKKLCECYDGENATIEAIAVSRIAETRIRNGKTIQKLIIRDETSTATITWFNQSYLKNKFEIRSKI